MAKGKTDKEPVATPATSATSALNEWGIPDWRDTTAYPADSSEWTSARWLWEFTRRRSDYRKDTMWLMEVKRHYEAARARKKTDPSPDAQCSYETLQQQFERTWRQYWMRWGYSPALDPRVSEYPQKDLLRWGHGNVRSVLGSSAERLKDRNTLTPNVGELAVTINLDRPLAEQLKTIERVAKEEQQKRHGRSLERRRNERVWVGYLRALDADEAGATLSEMAAQFFRDGILDRRKRSEGGYGPPPPQAADRLVRDGRKLQSNFPN